MTVRKKEQIFKQKRVQLADERKKIDIFQTKETALLLQKKGKGYAAKLRHIYKYAISIPSSVSYYKADFYHCDSSLFFFT